MSSNAVTIARNPDYAGPEALAELLDQFNLKAKTFFGNAQFAIVNMTEEQKRTVATVASDVLLVAPPVRNKGNGYELVRM